MQPAHVMDISNVKLSDCLKIVLKLNHFLEKIQIK